MGPTRDKRNSATMSERNPAGIGESATIPCTISPKQFENIAAQYLRPDGGRQL